ncbi:MAG TPA: NAD(P)/FAD-dependent oxidoreductase [Candidatus Hydrogenedentes bacterium]|nr:NAD(P)/FAD-dependent oxidoreductase [Candidatus Hydrogenedentota bacterium]HQE84420.1 NAD(P)/FAD-dependent oxidoreductase [Candidatus Hydrogenedentota bacterium]HQH54462.1 NAD(P)/FAD-dependent oxidoreductase [Candidatus Hydrogenedentota bacterium]HQM51373.1 NAD(P)/FAD-dependent oxidoreductase [Candidatus Hydrogenedentota bacterium]
MPTTITEKPHVVIVGGGFGGVHAAQHLKHADVHITLVDKRNFHLFQPLLYQVATGGLSPANVAVPLRSIFKRQRNVQVLLGDAVDIDLENRRLILADGSLPYDVLILAAGATHHYFGHDNWPGLAPGLKTIEDATTIRRRILLAFEAAERTQDPNALRALLTFIIVGAGPTGVELAGALCEIAKHTLRNEFRKIDPSQARVILLELGPRVLPSFPEKLSEKAAAILDRLGVSVRTGAKLKDIDSASITVEVSGREENIPTLTVLWAAGVRASPLGGMLAARAGSRIDAAGRVEVAPDLTVPGHPDVFIIGDLAACKSAKGTSLPAIAPVAIQQGKYVAELIQGRLAGRPSKPFRYRDPGMMATIGRSAAVAHLGRIQLSGLLAWLAWLFVHLANLIQFENRILVLTQWAWSYFTWNRSARLITGDL